MRQGQRNLLDRFLCLFTEVRPGESTTALVLMANVFLLWTAYYIIKPVREALILAGGGAEIKSYAAAGQAVLLLVAVPLYARLASRLRRLTLITVVTLFFVACLLGFYLLAGLGISLGVPFYLWVGIFNVMLVAQFWSYANDLYSTDQGKRLFVILGFGASGGAVVGSLATGWMIVPLGTYNLLLVSAGLLLVSLLLTLLADRRERRRRPVEQQPSSGRAPNVANDADTTTPIEYEPAGNDGKDITARYANGVKLFIRQGLRFGTCPVRFEGEDGWVETGDSGEMETHPASLMRGRQFRKGYPVDNHVRNFLDCVKTRQQPVSNADVAHHSITACHVANICMRLGRKVKWDPDNETFIGDEEANRLRSRAYREPWRM